MCSAQILHFSASGKPFWFNGSFRKNKAVGTSTKIANLAYYIPGAIGMEQNPSWEHRGNNIWCALGVKPVPLGNGKLMAKIVAAANMAEIEQEPEIPDY